jgi:predicted ArsR family transcriptional regulator
MEVQQSLMELYAKLSNNARETSRLAALKAAPKSGTYRYQILRALVAASDTGCTDDELAQQLSISPNTVRPRRLELVEGGFVCEGTRSAKSFFGNKAIAWIATPQGVRAVEDIS